VGGNGPSSRITPELNLWAQAIRGSARGLKRRREMGYKRGSSWAAAEPHYYEARGMAAPEGTVPATQIPTQTTAATAYRAPKRAVGAAFLARRRTALTVVGIVAGASVPAFALVAALTAPTMHTGDLNNVTADAPSASVPVQGPQAVEQPAASTQGDSAAAQQAAQQAAEAAAAQQQAAAQQAAADQAAAQQQAAQQASAQQAAAEAARSSAAADPAAKAPAAPAKHVVVKTPTRPVTAPSVHTEPSRPTKPANSDQHAHHSSRGEHSSHHSTASAAPSTSSGGTTITGGAPATPAQPSTPSQPTGPSVSQDPADPAGNATPADPAQDPSNPDYGADTPSQPAPAPATPKQPVADPAAPSQPDTVAPSVPKPPVAKHSGDRYEPRDTEHAVHASDAGSTTPAPPSNP
jgi:hypothetical protein